MRIRANPALRDGSLTAGRSRSASSGPDHARRNKRRRSFRPPAPRMHTSSSRRSRSDRGSDGASTAGMTELMEHRPVPVDRLEIGLRRRQLNIVLRGRIEGPTAADAEIDADGLDQRLYLRSIRPGSGGGAVTARSSGRPSHLRQVEHCEAFEEWDGLGFLAGLARALLLVVRNESGRHIRRWCRARPCGRCHQGRGPGETSAQPWTGKQCSITEPQRISTLIPE
jgi:hypothetical protein